MSDLTDQTTETPEYDEAQAQQIAEMNRDSFEPTEPQEETDAPDADTPEEENVQETTATAEEESEEVPESSGEADDVSEEETDEFDETDGVEEEEVETEIEAEAEAESESSGEVAELKAKLATLQGTITTLANQLLTQQQPPQLSQSPTVTTSAGTAQPPVETTNLLEGVDFDALLSDPEAFNDVLQKAVQLGHDKAVQTFSTQQTAQTQQQQVTQFYSKNEDLKPFSTQLSAVAQTIINEQNPDFATSEQVMEEAAKRTRAIFQLPVKTSVKSAADAGEKTVKRVVKTPAKARKTVRRKKPTAKKPKTDLQKDLDAMLKLDD